MCSKAILLNLLEPLKEKFPEYMKQKVPGLFHSMCPYGFYNSFILAAKRLTIHDSSNLTCLLNGAT